MNEGTEMLERIRASLQATRWEGQLVSDQGGDIEVMKEVERIAQEAWNDGFNDPA